MHFSVVWIDINIILIINTKINLSRSYYLCFFSLKKKKIHRNTIIITQYNLEKYEMIHILC